MIYAVIGSWHGGDGYGAQQGTLARGIVNRWEVFAHGGGKMGWCDDCAVFGVHDGGVYEEQETCGDDSVNLIAHEVVMAAAEHQNTPSAFFSSDYAHMCEDGPAAGLGLGLQPIWGHYNNYLSGNWAHALNFLSLQMSQAQEGNLGDLDHRASSVLDLEMLTQIATDLSEYHLQQKLMLHWNWLGCLMGESKFVIVKDYSQKMDSCLYRTLGNSQASV
jgi:hypothetical protein